MKGLIGKGFVGSNLLEQNDFDFIYDSGNIQDIKGKEFDLLVVAAPSGTKWLANRDPQKDKQSIDKLISCLKLCKAKQVVHISTVDVYKSPFGVDEMSPVELDGLHPYGRHRYLLENFIKSNFNTLTIRLPALFGKGLKKNFVYDILNDNCLELTHKSSRFQLYCIDYLWKDICWALDNDITLLNITSDSMSAREIARVLRKTFNYSDAPVVSYSVNSLYKRYPREQVINDLKKYEASHL
jgi:nucleoside-diphosphate-sugar epimerase